MTDHLIASDRRAELQTFRRMAHRLNIVAIGRDDKGQGRAPVNLDQNIAFMEVIRSRAKGVWKSGKGEATIAATPSRLEGA